MTGDSNRRGFLRDAALAGAALAAGAGALSVAGCCKEDVDQLKEELVKLRAENEILRARVQVRIDEYGNLVVDDPEIKTRLCEVWNQQVGKPHHSDPPGAPKPKPQDSRSRRGIHVLFTCKAEPATAGIPPQEHQVNSLCSC